MAFSLYAWWTRDTTLHTFLYCQFLIGVPFFIFNTYVIYQFQVVGYLIGTDIDGGPCTTYCIVPWGGTRLDLNSVLLYMNALGFGLGGALMVFLSAYSDFWSQKHLLVTFFIVVYGALSIPPYWLREYTVHDFQALSGLYTAFAVVTLIMIPVISVYIPHCMHNIEETTDASGINHGLGVDNDRIATTKPGDNSKRRSYGFTMSVLGSVANYVGSILMLIIVIILSQTLAGDAAQTAGLLITTVVGFITVAGSSVALWGLPPIASKPRSELQRRWLTPIVELFRPFKDLLARRNMLALLVSWTVYTDCTFAVSSVTSQLFIAELRPGALEYSLYSLAQSMMGVGCNLLFFFIRPRLRIRLETWLLIGYILILVIPVWGCIGLSGVDFGFKNRWEFYVQLFVFSLSLALVNGAFRVLFSELIPRGSEVEWFGLQIILSCGTVCEQFFLMWQALEDHSLPFLLTEEIASIENGMRLTFASLAQQVWINYVASGPLQNSTHQLRFPLVISLVFLIISVVIELCRWSLKLFEADRKRWALFDQDATTPSNMSEVGHADAAESVSMTLKV